MQTFVVVLAVGADLVYLNARVRMIEDDQRPGPAAQSIPMGTALLPMAANTVDGHSTLIASGREKLIFYMSTRCGVCAHQFPQWAAVMQTVGSSNAMFLIAGTTDVAEIHTYFASRGLAAAPTYIIDNDVMKRYAMFSVPRTFLVGRDGKLRQTWLGPVAKEVLIKAWQSHT